MSNQDINPNELMPADEQAAIGRAAILGHFEMIWAELQSTINQLKENPELVTREHVILYKDAIRHLMEWLRANGIEVYAQVSEAKGIDVLPGDRL
ncbi:MULTISPECIES: hypothetical protein [unclassified Arthrobacter]|uniref:hypothetical protein n=1 Tax=unclassified Arthrobacter TaxID=235627 RepID=UPI00254C7E14|nr:hypothetical protein [Arthrobacter sp. efr-133-TYG-120]